MTVPQAPTPMRIDQINMTYFRYRFTGNDPGSSEILQYQVGYGTNPNAVQKTMNSWGEAIIRGLTPGQVYYVWVRARNASGWSPWSTKEYERTVSGARVRWQGNWRYAVPMVRYRGKWRIAEAWVRHQGNWRKTNSN